MKKHYITPTVESLKFQTMNMIAASIPVSGETDDEARSKKFWGPSMFDEETEEDDNTDSWY